MIRLRYFNVVRITLTYIEQTQREIYPNTNKAFEHFATNSRNTT